MGSLYQRRVCRICKGGSKLKTCEAAGHEIAALPTWWMKYRNADGTTKCKSTETDKRKVAEKKLRQVQMKIDDGLSVASKLDRFFLKDAAVLVFNDYETNGKRTLKDAKRRIEKHLQPYFGARRLMTTISTDLVVAFQKHRQDQGASNAEINRELSHLKRMFKLAVQARRLPPAAVPYIPMLQESNARQGFFEEEQFESVRNHLREHLQGIATFAYLTGWRTPSEILTLEWRRVDFNAGEVRLDPGTTKNGEGRVFPFNVLPELRKVLETQRDRAKALQQRHGIITPCVFFYPEGARNGGRELKPGRQITESGYAKAWDTARVAAGCPGRLSHDFRRTAVRRLEQAGVPRSVAMKLTGHKTESVYRRYAIVADADLRSGVEKLAGYISGYTRKAAAPAVARRARNR